MFSAIAMGGLFRFCRLRWKFSGESVGALETRQFDSSLHRASGDCGQLSPAW